MAIFDSVTVSIADDMNGTFSKIFLDSFNEISVSEGRISEYFGVKSTSSNVKDSFIDPILAYKQFLNFIKDLKTHSVNKFP